MKQKIHSVENLENIIFKEKKRRKKIVLCHGVFDLLHVGHIKHFEQAKKLGDILIVSVTSNRFVNKGPKRPAFDQRLRLDAVGALSAVDFVVLSDNPTAVEIIQKIRPNIYCKGPDYKNHKSDISGEINNELKAIKKCRGKIVYTKDITFSSSNLINKFGNFYSIKEKSLINKIKKEYNFKKINNLIKKFKRFKVLVIGELIIDQYFFCEALGKSGKEPILVLKDIKNETYIGGAGAICRHLSQFSNQISLLSMIGEKAELLSKIKKKLNKSIKFNFIRKKNSPTILKKRFLDHVTNHKIFGVYSINDDLLTPNNEKEFNRKLRKLLPKHDIVIVSDYGHGLISKKSAQLICKKSKYLALNAQINAANVGYHSMRNYKNVDFVIINAKEIRHELRDKNRTIEILMKRLSQEQNIKKLVVTYGTDGSVMYDKKGKKFNRSEAYSKTAVDKIGAGDAMLSVGALCLKSGFSRELTLLIASLAAAQSVTTIGNKETLNKTKILKTLENILK